MGQQRPRDAPDLLPSRAQGHPPRCAPVHRGPAPHDIRGVVGSAGSGWTSGATSPSPTRSAARSSPPGWRTASSSTGRRPGSRRTRPRSSPYTLEYAERETGVPAEAIRELAHAFAKAPRAMICWTLGITEHHNAVDNVLALIALVLLTGHVGRYGSGVSPLRGQNNVQGGGDMGALPDRLPGFQHVENDELRAKFDAEWGVTIPPKRGWHLSGMFDAMERGRDDRHLLHRREPGPVGGRPEASHPPAVQPRLPGRPGSLPDEDGPARGRRPAGHGSLGRERRDRHQLRAPRPTRPQGGRAAAGSPRRHRDHLRAREPDGRRLGRGRSGGCLGGGPPVVPRPRRHELRQAGGGGRPALAVLRRNRIRASCSCTAGSGRTRSRGPRLRSCRSTTSPRWTSWMPTTRSG